MTLWHALSHEGFGRMASWLWPRHEPRGLLKVEGRTHLSVPLVAARASCGFPSPADDYLDQPLDFNELIIENPAATFAVRVSGDSMVGAGIFPGDIAVVNRAKTPSDRCIVVALLNGEFTIKRYRQRGTRIWLEADNPAFTDIEITEHSCFEVWGVISRCVRLL